MASIIVKRLQRCTGEATNDDNIYISKEEVMPFIEDVCLGKGNDGEVQQVKLNKDLFSDQDTQFLVRKSWRLDNHREKTTITKLSENEIKILRYLNHLQHPNIIRLLCSYTIDGIHNLLFPRFEMDLEYFLTLAERFGDFRENSTFYMALLGLVSALKSIHNSSTYENGVERAYVGFHHDFRPANILVSHNTFVLTDFGHAGLRLEEDEPFVVTYSWSCSDYKAPECMLEDFSARAIGQPFDIWSIGCLFLEIATYIELGPTGIQNLRGKKLGPGPIKSFYDGSFYVSDNLKPEVEDWFQELWTKSKTPEIRELVDLSRATLVVDQAKRPTAEQVFIWMEAFVKRVNWRSLSIEHTIPKSETASLYCLVA